MSEKRLRAQESEIVQDIVKGSRISRRGLFYVSAAGAAGLAGGHLAAGAAGGSGVAPTGTAQANGPVVKDTSKVMGIGGANYTGRWFDFDTFMTPIEKFYIRNHYPSPRLETHDVLKPENWSLKIHGASVENPVELTYDDILKMPSRTIVATMECHGNGRTLFWEQQGMEDVSGGNWGLGAVGQAEWKYVPMSEIFSKVGLKADAKEVLFWSGVDGDDMGRPMPVADIMERPDDIGLAYQMNGVDLPMDHGYPVRALVPGWGGTASIKWLRDIRVEPHRFWTRLNVLAEAFIGPEYEPDTPSDDDEFLTGVTKEDVRGHMVRWMNPKSTLTVPLFLRDSSPPQNYPLEVDEMPRVDAGQQTMRGYAWAPHGVDYVDYRINGGEWQRAQVQEPNLGRYTWIRFEFPWWASEGEHVIETRATDKQGNRQPAEVPFNELGMANNAIPKFRIRAA